MIRVATWVFIFAASTVVAVTDLWAAQQGPILVLLGIAAITLFVLQLVRPGPERRLLIVEGAIGSGCSGCWWP